MSQGNNTLMDGSKTAIYFPGLNGIRAIAAIAVVISHTTLALKDFNLNPAIFGVFADGKPKGLNLAGYGVSIFFVLSGFLITYLLLKEKEKSDIDVKKFYVRRILRIWPLYYLYFAIVILISWIMYREIHNLSSINFYIFFSANIPFILGSEINYLGHYWSLGVEEQFYLFWPWICKKVNRLLFFCISLLGIFVFVKLYCHVFYPNSVIELFLNVTRFHCMLIGAIGAILYYKKHQIVNKIFVNKTLQIISWAILFLVAINQFHIASVIDNEIISVVAVIIIIGQIEIMTRIVNLDLSLFDYLGKISYGIYVVHPLLILLLSKVIGKMVLPSSLKYILVYCLVLLLTLLVSHLSYTYFEKYFLNLKKRFVVINSSSVRLN